MKNILIIDDDPSFVELIHAKFCNDYRVISAGYGRKGLEILKEEQIDVCILEYILPEMNGDEVLAKIREIDRHLPIIFMTSYANLDLKYKLENGKNRVQFFLHKPPQIKYLKEIIGVCTSEKIIDLEKNFIKFSKKSDIKNKIKKKTKHKSFRLVEIVRLLKEEPDKWNPGKFSIKFNCNRRQIYRDFDELKDVGINIVRTENGYSVFEEKKV